MRRVDDAVGARAEVHEDAPLLVDRGLHAARLLERVAVPRLAVPAEEHIVRCVEKEDVRLAATALEGVERGVGLGEERAAPCVDHERHALAAALPAHVERLRHQRRWKVIERVVAQVFEDLHRLRLARARQTRDDDEVGAVGLGHPLCRDEAMIA